VRARGERPALRPPRGARKRGRGRGARALPCRAGEGSGAQAAGDAGRPDGRVHGGDGRAGPVTTVRAYVGLGANLGDREAAILEAADRLGASRLSTIRETEPWGYADQPPFLNAAAEVDTELAPRGLLDRLLEIERSLGRLRLGPRWGPRTIDLDLLLYGDEVVDEPGLVVPHPRLHERLFVLEPLNELDPALKIPGKGAVSTLLAEIQSAP
jgi:2-amino-4-hydroxy-6-hydroxymethyldihydropteridine diphosphokinase